MAYKIFISYPQGLSKEGVTTNFIAQKIQQDLEKHGAEVFLDILEIAAGEDIEKQILDNLMSCDELWVMVIPELQIGGKIAFFGSVSRPYIWLETGVAWYRGIPIVPVLPMTLKKSLSDDAKIPSVIKNRRAIELANTEEYEQALLSIKNKVERAKGRKRCAERVPTRMPVNIICEEDGICETASITDISKDYGGCFISTNVPVTINKELQCSFNVNVVHRSSKKYDSGSAITGIGAKII